VPTLISVSTQAVKRTLINTESPARNIPRVFSVSSHENLYLGLGRTPPLPRTSPSECVKAVVRVGIALNYGLDGRGFESWQGLGIFLFTTMSSPALGSIQPPIQGVLGALSLGVKRPVREADRSPPSSTDIKE
jgi:hypothetical protein